MLTSIASAPQTQVLPMPRATTAACEVLPPREVRMPCAAIMPGRSSGLVSRRTRITCSPVGGHLGGALGVEDGLAHGGAGRGGDAPRDRLRRPTPRSKVGNISCASCAPVTRRQRLVQVDHALVDELGRDDERRGRGPLADPGLQHPQLAALDGELDVAQVPVVTLQSGHDLASARRSCALSSAPARSQRARCCGCRRRRPRPGRWPGSRRRRPAHRWPGRG